MQAELSAATAVPVRSATFSAAAAEERRADERGEKGGEQHGAGEANASPARRAPPAGASHRATGPLARTGLTIDARMTKHLHTFVTHAADV